jgi:hypothetical protein
VYMTNLTSNKQAMKILCGTDCRVLSQVIKGLKHILYNKQLLEIIIMRNSYRKHELYCAYWWYPCDIITGTCYLMQQLCSESKDKECEIA